MYKTIKHDIIWMCPECGSEVLCDVIESIESPELKGFECQECLTPWWVFPPDGLSFDEWVERKKGGAQ